MKVDTVAAIYSSIHGASMPESHKNYISIVVKFIISSYTHTYTYAHTLPRIVDSHDKRKIKW